MFDLSTGIETFRLMVLSSRPPIKIDLDTDEYRYLLTRRLVGQDGTGTSCLFVMLNPSTADAVSDDPTIRRCIGFANREGFSQLEVVNLYGYRATEPRDLFAAIDPVGPRNDRVVADAVGRTDLVVAAWGNWGAHDGQRLTEVIELLERSGKPVFCFGLTNQVQPRHPLYLRSDASLEEFALGAVSTPAG